MTWYWFTLIIIVIVTTRWEVYKDIPKKLLLKLGRDVFFSIIKFHIYNWCLFLSNAKSISLFLLGNFVYLWHWSLGEKWFACLFSVVFSNHYLHHCDAVISHYHNYHLQSNPHITGCFSIGLGHPQLGKRKGRDCSEFL